MASWLQEVFKFLVVTANMTEIPGMNIINKFADSLGMPVVNLNIRMSFCRCSRKPVTEFGL